MVSKGWEACPFEQSVLDSQLICDGQTPLIAAAWAIESSCCLILIFILPVLTEQELVIVTLGSRDDLSHAALLLHDSVLEDDQIFRKIAD